MNPNQTLCAAKIRESQVVNELSMLDGSIQRLHTSVERLAERLDPVMRSQCDPCCNEKCELDTLVPLADSIRIKRFRIEDVVTRINTWLDTIEL